MSLSSTVVVVPKTKRPHVVQTPSFESAAGPVLSELQTALLGLIAGLPAAVRTAADLQRVLGIDSKLASQAVKVAFAREPLAAGGVVPPRTSMGRLLNAAAARGVPEAALNRVRAAFDHFESLVQRHAGDRARFEIMAANWSPAERERLDLASREAAFDAMVHLRGMMIETYISTYFLQPNEDDSLLDSARVRSQLGLVCFRPSARFFSTDHNFGSQPTNETTLDGGPIVDPGSTILEPFCTQPLPRYVSRLEGPTRHYWLENEDIGRHAAADMVSARVRRGLSSRYAEPGGRVVSGAALVPEEPVRRLVFDVLVRPDTYRDVPPRALAYETAGRGIVSRFDQPDREHNRMEWIPPIRSLGRGIENFHLPGVPRYVEMLHYACDKLGWDGSQFIGYRCEVDYPVYSWQIMIGFDLFDAGELKK